jgi:shikimate dehydrogenase
MTGLAAPFLLNATPLGMAGPEAQALAFPEEMIAACDVACDVVAMPAQTPFLARARALGKKLISGSEIIVLQAVEQFVRYTGVRPSAAQVADAAAFARSAG